MGLNAHTFSATGITIFLGFGIALSYFVRDSCKLVHRNYDVNRVFPPYEEYDDDSLLENYPLPASEVFGLFQMNKVTVTDITFDSENNKWNYIIKEECTDDFEGRDIDYIHQMAQLMSYVAPAWALLMIIVVNVGTFFKKYSRNFQIILMSFLLPLTVVFNAAIYLILGSELCAGSPMEDIDGYNEEEDSPYDDNHCEDDDDGYKLIFSSACFFMAAWIGLTTLCYKPTEVPGLCRRTKEDASDDLETDNDSDGVETGNLKDGNTLEEVEVAEKDFQSENEVSNHSISIDDDTQSNDMLSDPHVESLVVVGDK